MAAVDLLDLRTTTEPEAQAVVELARFDGGNKIGLVGRTCMPAPMYLAVAENLRWQGRGFNGNLRVTTGDKESRGDRKDAKRGPDRGHGLQTAQGDYAAGSPANMRSMEK